MLEQLDICKLKKKPQEKPHTLYKINSKWIVDIKIKHKTINFFKKL